MQISCVKTIVADAIEYTSENLFDRVLVDAPCSGLGTLSKKPDIKWKKELVDIRKVSELQFNILTQASKNVKVDGILVYSTCTIEPEENYDVVKRFLDDNSNFVLEDASKFVPKAVVDSNGCVQTFPHKHKMDGAFAARLRRIS